MLAIPFSQPPSSPRGGSAPARGASRPALLAPAPHGTLSPSASAETETLARPAAHEPTPEEQALAEQAAAFNQSVRLQSEAEREMNALLAMSMEQIKHDDEFLKKWIALI